MENIIGLLGKIVSSNSAEKNDIPIWQVVACSVIGGLFLILADIVSNDERTVTARLANSLGTYLPALDSVWFESLAFMVIIGMGLALCFVFRPKTRPVAFSLGSSVMAVLFGINTGAVHTITAIKAAPIELQDSVPYSYTKPRRYGAFGLGTTITGKSNARLQTIRIAQPASVDCRNEYTVGEEQYCSVDANIAEHKLGITLKNNAKQIWIQIP